MNVLSEFSPLLAAAAPVLMIAVMNICLAFQGERDTPLFPDLRPYPTATKPATIAHCPRTEIGRVVPVEPAQAHEEIVREAA